MLLHFQDYGPSFLDDLLQDTTIPHRKKVISDFGLVIHKKKNTVGDAN